MLKVWDTVEGTRVFIEQPNRTLAPRLGMRGRSNALQIDALLTTDETKELVEVLLKTLPPITAFELVDDLHQAAFLRSERARKRRKS